MDRNNKKGKIAGAITSLFSGLKSEKVTNGSSETTTNVEKWQKEKRMNLQGRRSVKTVDYTGWSPS
eukprot:905240-Ditylum_brightwellii.AAC.2